MPLSRRRSRRLTRTLLIVLLSVGVIHAMTALGGDDDHRTAATAVGKPTVKTPSTLFRDQMIVEGIHGFSSAEVARIARATRSQPLVVTDGEAYVSRGSGRYNELPLAAMAVVPGEYAAAAGSAALRAPLSTGVVIATSTAALFGYRVGARIHIVHGATLPVTAVVSDSLLTGHQMAVSRNVATGLGAHADYVIVTAGGAQLAAEQQAITHALPTRRLRFVLPTTYPYFSPSGDVLTQSQLDQRFGAFTLRETSSGFAQDPGWMAAHLVRRRIVQLGWVVCNRALITPLTGAMKEITRRGLGHVINTADFIYEGGCWNSRMSRFEPGNISHHAWGAALDINVAANPLGAVPHQDPRLVAIMQKYGFTWGGRWLRRDGTHFEWVGNSRAA
jgi:hypothetical protein